MNTPPEVPGLVLEQEIGSGGHGSVWLARDEQSGDPVAVKLVILATAEQYRSVQREASLLASVDHPHLVPFYGAIEIDGGVALVSAFADGGSLADVLAERGALSPGEVVTICAPIAEALSDVHRQGLIHGDIKPTDIVFTGDGRPMLSDLGISRLVGQQPAPTEGFTPPEVYAAQPPSPATDVYGLAAVGILSLTGQLPTQPLVLSGIAPVTQGALTQALQAEPALRPGAGALSDAIYALAEPEPVLLAPLPAGDDVSTASDRPRRRSGRAEGAATGRRRARPRRRDILVGLVIILTIPVVALGARAVWNQVTGNPDAGLLPGAGRVTAPAGAANEEDLCGGPQPAPTEAPPEVTDWTPVVERLMDLRATAFNTLDPMILCEIFVPTSPYLAGDYELLQDYQEAGVRPSGLRFEVVDVELVSEAGDTPVVLEITDRAPEHQLIDEDGEVVSELPGVPEATWRAELVVASDASGWRFS